MPLSPRRGWVATLLDTARFEVRALSDSVLPFGWSPEYVREDVASAIWLIPLGVILVAIAILARRRRTQLLSLAVAWPMIAALPMCPLVGPANPRADRYIFLGVLGGALVWGWVAEYAARRMRGEWRVVALAVVCLPLVVLSRQASAAWESDLSVWSAAAERAPKAPRAWTGLSRALRLKGDYDAADEAIERAIDIDPEFIYARVTRVYNRLARGDIDGARRELVAIDALGGRHPGLRRAQTCVELPPREASACIGAPR